MFSQAGLATYVRVKYFKFADALTKIYLITCVLNQTSLIYLPANDTYFN